MLMLMSLVLCLSHKCEPGLMEHVLCYASVNTEHLMHVLTVRHLAQSYNTLPTDHLLDRLTMQYSSPETPGQYTNQNSHPPICQSSDQVHRQATLSASRGAFRCDLTFQVVNTDQPALLSTDTSKTLKVIAINADFAHKCSTNNQQPTIISKTTAIQQLAHHPPLQTHSSKP